MKPNDIKRWNSYWKDKGVLAYKKGQIPSSCTTANSLLSTPSCYWFFLQGHCTSSTFSFNHKRAIQNLSPERLQHSTWVNIHTPHRGTVPTCSITIVFNIYAVLYASKSTDTLFSWVSLLTVWQETKAKYTCVWPSTQLLSQLGPTTFLARKYHKMTPPPLSNLRCLMWVCKNKSCFLINCTIFYPSPR